MKTLFGASGQGTFVEPLFGDIQGQSYRGHLWKSRGVSGKLFEGLRDSFLGRFANGQIRRPLCSDCSETHPPASSRTIFGLAPKCGNSL